MGFIINVFGKERQVDYHPNGGGIVEVTANVPLQVYVSPAAMVLGFSTVEIGCAIQGAAIIDDYALISAISLIEINEDLSAILEFADVILRYKYGIGLPQINQSIEPVTFIRDHAIIKGNAKVGGGATVGGYVVIDGDTEVIGGTYLDNARITRNAKIIDGNLVGYNSRPSGV